MTERRTAEDVEAVFREEWGRLLATLVRQWGDLDLAEEVASDAVASALQHWPVDGVPTRPAAWLLTVARRRAVDLLRRDRAYAARLALLQVEADRAEPGQRDSAQLETDDGEVPDERLRLFFTCCHPALPLEAQTALTLRCLAGLTTPEVARAFLVPPVTMAQRIVRADLVRDDLAEEAIRLARILHRLIPGHREVTGLLALLLLIDARRAARTRPAGELVLLGDQDRALWDRALIEEGRALVVTALRGGAPGPYTVQAAIAALHDEAASVATTDWPQVVALYDVLSSVAPSPLVALNRAVAVAMVDGPATGLALLDELPGLDAYHE
jgi:RNA polymerase sigma-70 factor (ECF subfamily)